MRLTKQTVYCFDSESFRYLAAMKTANLDLGNRDDYARSWERSVKETQRMLNHIRSVKPHSITATASLNTARKIITDLTIPMAEISRNISLNIQLIKEENSRLADRKLKGKQLKEALIVNRIDLETSQLEQPLTVCGHKSCVEVITNSNGNLVLNYKQRCHVPCNLKNVRTDTLNTEELEKCSIMINGQCASCGHCYKDHLHVTYEHREVMRQVEDVIIRQLLDSTMSDVDKRAHAVSVREMVIDEYRNEQMQIDIAGAKFGFYLKHNSITPYNDARVQYIQHQIKQEENKLRAMSGVTRSYFDQDARRATKEMIKSLENTMAAYREYDRMLEESVKNSSNLNGYITPLSGPDDIEQEVQRLYALEHFGKDLENARKNVVHKHQTARNEVTYELPQSEKSTMRGWFGSLFN